MSKILILHPYRETYTDIYSCLSQNHQYTILIDDSKSDSFETNKPTNVTLVTTQHYPEKRKETSQGILQQSHFDAIVALDEFDMLQNYENNFILKDNQSVKLKPSVIKTK